MGVKYNVDGNRRKIDKHKYTTIEDLSKITSIFIISLSFIYVFTEFMLLLIVILGVLYSARSAFNDSSIVYVHYVLDIENEINRSACFEIGVVLLICIVNNHYIRDR